MKRPIKEFAKSIAANIFPSYRVALRNEERLARIDVALTEAHTDSSFLRAACFANEIHDTHTASFSEFKGCHKGQSVVVVACGPTMKYYTQLPGLPHIGVNKAFQNRNISLDYFFTTDYEHWNDWFEELKDYKCVKFFGQYPTGAYRDQFQVIERLIEENQGRRFFQGAPSEDIHLNIEYYPLMGFYSIVFQAIHFALYTRAKKILLVGCDCTADGYFDGSNQLENIDQCGVPLWLNGYTKLKAFVERFYPDVEMVSVNPVGLKGMFRDVYTENYLDEHPGTDRGACEILSLLRLDRG